jgi:hypothetical protein
MEKSAFKKNGLTLQSSVPNPEFTIQSPLCILNDSYKKYQIHEPGLIKFWTGEWNLDPQVHKNM